MTQFDKHLVNDIGIHAGQEALKTMLRICDTLVSNEERTAATVAAFAYIISVSMGMKMLGDHVYEAMLEAARKIHEIDPNYKRAVEAIARKESE